ncbi:MAG TPA: helix-turn-helix domain-containing protein [Lysobacter sp.]
MKHAQVRLRVTTCRHQAGISGSMEAAFRFLKWAEGKADRLTVVDIREHLGCSRATAYRWFNAFNAARGKA